MLPVVPIGLEKKDLLWGYDLYVSTKTRLLKIQIYYVRELGEHGANTDRSSEASSSWYLDCSLVEQCNPLKRNEMAWVGVKVKYETSKHI